MKAVSECLSFFLSGSVATYTVDISVYLLQSFPYLASWLLLVVTYLLVYDEGPFHIYVARALFIAAQRMYWDRLCKVVAIGVVALA